jgi:hypothetical protein
MARSARSTTLEPVSKRRASQTWGVTFRSAAVSRAVRLPGYPNELQMPKALEQLEGAVLGNDGATDWALSPTRLRIDESA